MKRIGQRGRTGNTNSTNPKSLRRAEAPHLDARFNSSRTLSEQIKTFWIENTLAGTEGKDTGQIKKEQTSPKHVAQNGVQPTMSLKRRASTVFGRQMYTGARVGLHANISENKKI